MGIKETAEDLVEQGKAALDANGDGKVEAQEVLDALGEGAMDAAGAVADAATTIADEFKKGFGATADGAAEAVDEIKKGFDADGDGEVSFDEVKVVAEGAANKAKQAVADLVDKFKE